MTRYGHMVMGPAGSGKSTYCAVIHDHMQALRRSVKCINLDPAAEAFKYPCEVDVRDLISSDDVMEELHYGPNGALVYAMEYLCQNMDWLDEQLDDFAEDEYFLFDCPGQIELYNHVPVMRQFVDHLQQRDIRLVGVYCMEASFCIDPCKFISGSLTALSAMVHLELPHINVLTKCDLIVDAEDDEAPNPVAEIMEQDVSGMVSKLHESAMPPKFRKLHEAMASLLDDFSLVSFAALNVQDEETIDEVLHAIHSAVNFGEDEEPRIPEDEERMVDLGDNEDGGMFDGMEGIDEMQRAIGSGLDEMD